MRIVGKIFAFIFVIVFVAALLVSVLAYDTGRVVFHAPLVKQIITDIATQSDLIPAGLQWYASHQAQLRYEAGEAEVWQDEPNILELLGLLTIDDWRAIRHEVLSDEILQAWVAATVDGAYVWIDSDARVPAIQWDLSLFKARVASEHGRNAVQIVFDTLDPCTEEQIADFKTRLAAAPGGKQTPYNLCRFPDPWYHDQISDYHNALVLILANIPELFDFTTAVARDDNPAGAGLNQVKLQLRLIRSATRWAALVPAVLLLFILAFAIRTLRELGNWWGVPLTISGILLVLLTILYRSPVAVLMSFGPLNEIPSLIRAEALEALMRLAVEIFRPMLWQAGLVGVLGIALIVVGALVKPAIAETEL